MLASSFVRFAYSYLLIIYGYATQAIAHTTRAQLLTKNVLTGKNRKIP
ncbi:hypothetical protein [Nodularia sphaerocarpa]|nr:hypothetical protein [Nodularia sphaerocarpa]MDB9372473.1 hypothetical protein [Nodularia sphaerocarpa CS-585]MDB9377643.1 hypothetical protein [Nodularia sphaerocarpa CS-585A2]